MTQEEIFTYVADQYGTEPEYLWAKYPGYAVLRNNNGKWYGLVMDVPAQTLGISTSPDPVDILVVKCPTEEIDLLTRSAGFLPAYHMSKQHWITLVLDNPAAAKQAFSFLDASIRLTA